MFFVVFDLLESKHYALQVSEGKSVFDRVADVMSSILKGSPEAKNFNVKSMVLSQMFKTLVPRTLSLVSDNKTSNYLQILTQAITTEWKTIEEKTKQVSVILRHLNQTLIDQGGIVINDESIKTIDGFMKDSISILYKEKKEPAKVELLQTIKRLLEVFHA